MFPSWNKTTNVLTGKVQAALHRLEAVLFPNIRQPEVSREINEVLKNLLWNVLDVFSAQLFSVQRLGCIVFVTRPVTDLL